MPDDDNGSSSDDNGSSSSGDDETRDLLARINGIGAEAFNFSSVARDNPATKAILIGLRTMTDTVKDPEFWKAVYHTLKNHVKEHPWQYAFLIIALVLMCNPIGLAGFGALGPVAGSLAAGWQATMGGYVAAGSAFAILQSLGMLGALAIPMSGLGLFGAALAVPKIIEWCTKNLLPLLRRWWDGQVVG